MANGHRLAPRQTHVDPASRFRVDRFPNARPAQSGNVERYAEAIAGAGRLHLDETDETGQIAFLLRVADLQDHSPAMRQLLDDLVSRVAPFIAFHNADHPFATAPRHVLNGPIIIGTQVNDRRTIGLTPTDLMQHGRIVGPSGSGKTTLLVQIVRWLLLLRLLLGLIDTKDDFGWLLRRPDVLLLDERARWNPLAVPPFLSVRDHALEIRNEINTRFFGGQWQAQILDDALLRLYERTLTPCMQDLVDEIGRGAYPREAPLYAEARRST